VQLHRNLGVKYVVAFHAMDGLWQRRALGMGRTIPRTWTMESLATVDEARMDMG